MHTWTCKLFKLLGLHQFGFHDGWVQESYIFWNDLRIVSYIYYIEAEWKNGMREKPISYHDDWVQESSMFLRIFPSSIFFIHMYAVIVQNERTSTFWL